MNIQDALKETGKAVSTSRNLMCYAQESAVGVLCWYLKKNKEFYQYASLEVIGFVNWQPYHPEPKCLACTLADKFKKDTEGGFFKDNLTLDVMESHLRKYHCTCKEDL